MLRDLLRLRSRPIATRKDWAAKRAQIRDAVYSIIGKPPLRKPPLSPEIVSEENLDGYLRRKVSYQVERDERVSAYLLIPHRLRRPAPAVLCLHETRNEGKDILMEIPGLDRRECHDYAIDLVKRGYVTLSPDHLCAGERVPRGFIPYDTRPFYDRHPGWSAVGKALWDNRRALDYLETLNMIDPGRLGAIGHSLGAHSAIFLAAFDQRVKTTMASCGLTTFEEDEKRLEWARDHWYIYMPKLRPLFLAGEKAPFDFHELVSLIAPRAFLNSTALNDQCFASTDAVSELAVKVNKVYRLLDAEDKFACYLHGQRHSFTREVKSLAYTWFDLWL